MNMYYMNMSVPECVPSINCANTATEQNREGCILNRSGSTVIQNNDGYAIPRPSKPHYPYMLIGPVGILAI